MKQVRRSYAQIKAREILSSLYITKPEDLIIEDIAWIRGVLVQEGKLIGAEARLICKGSHGIIRVKRDIPEKGRKRFAISHEIGHFELHKKDSPLNTCTSQDMLLWNHKRIEENEANIFAAELLMPEDFFKKKCQSIEPIFNLIEELAHEFSTTLTATIIRYIEFTPYRCALVVSQDKEIKWYVSSENFQYHLQPGTPLNTNSLAIDFFNGKEIQNKIEPVLASAWLLDKAIDPRCEILEQSKALPRYDTVLTLLWIHEDIDGKISLDEDENKDFNNDHIAPNGKRWRW
jgi:Zn-dependent peptidase ImmA (M78 family)